MCAPFQHVRTGETGCVVIFANKRDPVTGMESAFGSEDLALVAEVGLMFEYCSVQIWQYLRYNLGSTPLR